MKKRFLAAICAALLAISLSACGSGDSGGSQAPSAPSGTASQPADLPEGMTVVTELGISVPVPEGYEKMSDDPLIYAPSNYPEVSDNITIITGKKDKSFDILSESNYQKLLESMFEDKAVSMERFERLQINGVDALAVRYTVTMESGDMQQTQFILNGESQMYTVTYTVVNGTLGKYVEQSGQNIKIAE